MPDQTTQSSFINDFERTLSSLDTALTDATRAVTAIRSYIPQFAALAQVVATIETAVAQAHQNLDIAPAAAAPAPASANVATALRAVAPVESAPALEQPVAVEAIQEEKKAPSGPPQVLRLHVTKTSGSLDLKTVDNALNEHSEIVDLALLDYDGRQATLKVWISGPIDQQSLQESLTADLLQRVGEDAEVKIEFEQESAAA